MIFLCKKGGKRSPPFLWIVLHTGGQWFKSTIAHHVTGLHNEELPLRNLIEVLLGAGGKRRIRIMLRHMGNEELFTLYDSDLVLRLYNAKSLSDTRKTLSRFKEHLGEYPPLHSINCPRIL